jgi:hypothetical protein
MELFKPQTIIFPLQNKVPVMRKPLILVRTNKKVKRRQENFVFVGQAKLKKQNL